MRGSFLRLVASSVLLSWALVLTVVLYYASHLSWIEQRAQGDGVFLAHELLDELPPAERAARVAELQVHYAVPLGLMTHAEAERRLGYAVAPGETAPLRIANEQEWLFMAFNDGEGVLAAGPVHPSIPFGVQPVGILLALAGLPLIAALIALRLERELRKVERASEALGTGELSARVDNERGPSSELAASFNAMAERVERLIRARDELVQAVSHELGSPLSRLRFHLALLEEHAADEQDERLASMTRELDALDELVAELLHYVQSDEMALDRQPFDPSRGLADLAEIAQLEAPEDRAVVDVTVRAVTVVADQRLFLRAIENLLRNAMQHAKGEVHLEVLEEGEHVRVTVHDDGSGIPETLRDKVLAPFVRLEADRGRGTGGVGLGLAIVGRILERHDGRLEIGTSPLGGAMVSTLWPGS